jgi:hypothetical protein
VDGSIRSSGEPEAGAAALASLAGASVRTLSLGRDGDLAFDAGRVMWGSVRAETDDKGAFAIRGLEARAYRLEVEAHETREVVAPATVEFDDAVARVAVIVRGKGLPLAGATVEVRRESGALLSRVTDAAGGAGFAALPGEVLVVGAFAAGFARQDLKIAAADGVEVAFDLDLLERLATLEVSLRAGEPLPSVCVFDLLPANGGAPIRRSAAVEENRFVLRDLAPGGYSVVALPGGRFLPSRGDADLGSGETAELALEVHVGGYLVVRFLEPGPLPEVWLQGVAGAASAWTVVVDALHSGLLAPGPYVVHVLGAEIRSLPADVRSGEVVTLVLGPE